MWKGVPVVDGAKRSLHTRHIPVNEAQLLRVAGDPCCQKCTHVFRVKLLGVGVEKNAVEKMQNTKLYDTEKNLVLARTERLFGGVARNAVYLVQLGTDLEKTRTL